MADKYPDPRKDADEYLEAHKVKPLFQELGTRLMFERPEDPNAFLIKQLTQMQKLQNQDKPVLFFSETDVTTMFEMFDPTGRGSIDTKQYNQVRIAPCSAPHCCDFCRLPITAARCNVMLTRACLYCSVYLCIAGACLVRS